MESGSVPLFSPRSGESQSVTFDDGNDGFAFIDGTFDDYAAQVPLTRKFVPWRFDLS